MWFINILSTPLVDKYLEGEAPIYCFLLIFAMNYAF